MVKSALKLQLLRLRPALDSPLGCAIFSLVRVNSCPARIVRKSLRSAIVSRLGRVAQLAEHSALNRQVEGSIPSASTISFQILIATTPMTLLRQLDLSV
jgi:hypothetical protein